MNFEYTKSGPIFNMHSYWTKQPVEPIIYFINKYSSKNDLILDPFSGSGMTGVGAILTQRNAILSDISPISLHISKGYCTYYSTSTKLDYINHISSVIHEKISQFYTTRCIKCDNEGTIKFSIVGEEWEDFEKNIEKRGEKYLNYEVINKNYNKFHGYNLIKLCYKCTCSNEKLYKFPDKKDFDKFNSKIFKNFYYPKESFFGQEPKRNYKKGIKKVYQLYSNRNLSALSIILSEIENITDKKIKQLFLFAFTSISFNTSLMSRYREQYENTSIKMGTFYMPSIIKDNNVLESFERKLKTIIKGNEIIFSNNNQEVKVINNDATQLEGISDKSVDYIYTDPPYSDVISYSELNIVYESWLKKYTNVKKELIVSKDHDKTLENYYVGMLNFMNSCYRVLKENKYLTLVFHNANLEHWYYLQKAIVESSFVPVIEVLPIRLTSKSKTASQHATSKKMQGFLVFNFKKDANLKKFKLKKLTQEEYKLVINKTKIDAMDKGYKSESEIYDYVINKLIFNYVIDPSIII